MTFTFSYLIFVWLGTGQVGTPMAAISSPTETMTGMAADADAVDEATIERWYVPNDGDHSRFIGPGGLPSLHLLANQDVWRLCEDATGLLVGPTDRRLPSAGIYISNLRGTAHRQQACRAGDFAPGASVCLVPEPDNPYDQWAVAVYDATRTHLGAYVNKQNARLLSRLLGDGTMLEAISLRGTPAGQRCDQISILAAAPHTLAQIRQPRPDRLPTPVYLR